MEGFSQLVSDFREAKGKFILDFLFTKTAKKPSALFCDV
jgi:hypothetical protein